jgi:Transcriptional regulator
MRSAEGGRQRGPRFDLNLYRVLDAIYAEGSLTKAGRRLGLSQPATSHALARLREAFDDPLFIRSAHGMVPTGPGRKA